jgi:hypothetical protein
MVPIMMWNSVFKHLLLVGTKTVFSGHSDWDVERGAATGHSIEIFAVSTTHWGHS